MSRYKAVLWFVLVVAVVAMSGCDLYLSPDSDDDSDVTVMTYNVYVGSDLLGLFSITDQRLIPGEVANVYDNVMATDFPARAAAIAKSVKEHDPHLIGLQEISLVRRESMPQDQTVTPPNAADVILDFLAILQAALQAESLMYEVAATVMNSDIELPMITEHGTIDHARLTTYDALLARSDVSVSRPSSANYATRLPVSNLGGEVARGYVAVDATVAGVTYRVANTHLEAYHEPIRSAQATELVGVLSDESLPLIVMGDFNSVAPDGPVYKILTASGYVDVWQEAAGAGYTCCQAADLKNEETALARRIDLIFVRNAALAAAQTNTVGDQASDRLESGLWPSDHAGVVAKLTFE